MSTTTQKKAPSKKAAAPRKKPSEPLIESSRFDNIVAEWSETEFTGESGTVDAARVRDLLGAQPRTVRDLLDEHPAPLLSAMTRGEQ